MITRRRLLVALGAGAVVLPLGSFAQQQTLKVARIGLLGVSSATSYSSQIEAFRAGLRDLGYGQNLADNYRRAATYVDKILKGAKPAELPVEQPTTLELIINDKTAKTLGMKIPADLLLRADKVIE
jgi:ABC transporter substrate binding protein